MKRASKYLMPKADPPCLDCVDRTVGCHGTCEKYSDFKRKRLDLMKQIRNNQKKDKLAEHVLVVGAIKQSGKKPPER